MWPLGRRAGKQASDEGLEAVFDNSRGGGTLATIISAFALVFSGFSFYESVLKAPKLAVYVPTQIAYTDPDRPESPMEAFIVPVTLANDGARTGTVLAIDLKVTNPRTSQSKLFHAVRFGPWSPEVTKPFAPISLAGKAAFSEAIQFLPREGEKVARIVDLEPGEYVLEISARLVAAEAYDWLKPEPAQPLVFKMRAGQMDYRRFSGAGTMPMWAPDYQPAATR